MKNMKELKVWECQHCKQLFKTENRHDCKKDPEKKNCFSCKWLETWEQYAENNGWEPPTPKCMAKPEEMDWQDWDLEEIKRRGYDMQCECYCKGEYWKYVFVAEHFPF